MLIAVLGPDGSGKTTLSLSLAEKFDNLSYIYFGNNLESRKYVYFDKFLRKNKKGKIYTLLKYVFILINDFHYYKISKERHFIADRCPIDKLLGAKITNKRSRYFYHRITQFFMPKPDIIIFLHGDSNLLYERKKEISKEIIDLYINFYKQYLTSNNINNINIDTTKNNFEETLEICYSFLKKIV